jgi:MFS family permease
VFRLSRPALLFLLHSVMLNFALAVAALLYNLALARLGYDRYPIGLPLIGSLPLLGILNSLPVLSAGLSSLPIWALVTNRGPRAALILGALLHGIALVSVALRPEPLPLLFGAAVSGPASVLFQLSAAPLMMRASNDQTRDGLFSLNAGLNIAVFGLGSLLGGALPGMIAGSLGVAEQAPAAYRGAFALAAGCSLLAALPLWWLRLDLIQADATRADKQARTAESGVSTALAQLRRAPWATLRFLVAPLLISFGAALLIPYLNLYFQRRYGLPDLQIGAILALVNIVTGAATLAAPQLSRRLGKIGECCAHSEPGGAMPDLAGSRSNRRARPTCCAVPGGLDEYGGATLRRVRDGTNRRTATPDRDRLDQRRIFGRLHRRSGIECTDPGNCRFWPALRDYCRLLQSGNDCDVPDLSKIDVTPSPRHQCNAGSLAADRRFRRAW